MFQRSEIGKYKSKKSIADAMMNKTCVTPNNEEYKLVEVKTVNRKKIWVYEVTKPALLFKFESIGQLDLSALMSWIKVYNDILGLCNTPK